MESFSDNEALTANMDDVMAGKILRILEKIENQAPGDLDHELHVVSLLNRLSADEENLAWVQKVISRMEKRYGQV